MIQSELATMGIQKGWPKSDDELKDRITTIAHGIPKSWLKKSFQSLPARWKKCVEVRGKLTDFYCLKNT